jgi:hypothetical protein
LKEENRERRKTREMPDLSEDRKKIKFGACRKEKEEEEII